MDEGLFDPGLVDELQQPRPPRPPQRLQPALQKVAGVPPLQRQVGDDADRHEVKALLQLGLASGPGEESLDDLVGDAHAGKSAQRVVPVVKLRIDQGEGVGQQLGQIVVIGNDDIDARFTGEGRRFDRGDPGVAGQQQSAKPLFDVAVQDLRQHPVRLALTDRNVEGDLRPEPFKHGDEQGRRSLSVDVEVTPYEDALPVADRPLDASDPALEVVQGLRPGRVIGIRVEESARFSGVVDAAPGQNPGGQGASRGRLEQGR